MASFARARRAAAVSLAALALAALLVVSGIGAPTAGAQTAIAPVDASRALIEDERNTIDIVDTYGPSVVAITVTAQGRSMAPEDILENIPEPFRDFFGPRLQPGVPRPQRSAGSGFVIEGGLIVTNLHVVQAALRPNAVALADGATIAVRFPGADEALPVRVVGANPDIDVALLELEDPATLPADVLPIPVANSDEVRVGQKVVAIGNPFGLASTVTTGIVSAIERDRPGFAGIDIPFVQTDAAINPGNSGGPLLDSTGRLIGINNAIISPSGGFAGIGFAVPSNLLVENFAALRAGGLSGFAAERSDPDRPLIGIVGGLTVDDYPDMVRDSLGLPPAGVVVTAVSDGSPAMDAGLRGPRFTVGMAGEQLPAGGDIITAIDGAPVATIEDIQRAVLAKAPGDSVELTVWREGELRTVRVVLAAASDVDGG